MGQRCFLFPILVGDGTTIEHSDGPQTIKGVETFEIRRKNLGSLR